MNRSHWLLLLGLALPSTAHALTYDFLGPPSSQFNYVVPDAQLPVNTYWGYQGLLTFNFCHSDLDFSNPGSRSLLSIDLGYGITLQLMEYIGLGGNLSVDTVLSCPGRSLQNGGHYFESDRPTAYSAHAGDDYGYVQAFRAGSTIDITWDGTEGTGKMSWFATTAQGYTVPDSGSTLGLLSASLLGLALLSYTQSAVSKSFPKKAPAIAKQR